MIIASIVLFAISAILGATILIKWLMKENASSGVIYSHGIVAAAALVTLIVYAVNHPNNFPKASLILFIVSALGGFFMFFRDLAKKSNPLFIAFVHALLAVSGFVALILFAIPS